MKYIMPNWLAFVLENVYLTITNVLMLIRGCNGINEVQREDNIIYVLPRGHIGDMCYVISFLGQYKKLHEGKKMVLLATKDNVRILRFYEGVYDKVLITEGGGRPGLVHDMTRVYWLLNRYKLLDRDDIVCFYEPDVCKECLCFTQINAVECTKRIMFNLPECATPSFPKYSTVQNEQFEDYRKEGNKIIINPYSLTADDLPYKFWEQLVCSLQRLGYEVYTNVCKDQKVIEGTKELRCSLNDLFSYANEADYFISRRSGIMDLLISCKCKFIAICANDEWLKFYTLSAWGCNPYVYEQYGEPDVGKIMEYIEQTKDL